MNKRYEIAFRCDASNNIGLGHAMRCIALALALKDLGYNSFFIMSQTTDYIKNKLNKYSIPFKITNDSNTYNFDQIQDALKTIKTLFEINSDIIVVDHYQIELQWYQLVSKHITSIVTIDDMADKNISTSLIINPNYNNLTDRYFSLCKKAHQVLFGFKYALLLPEYNQLHDSLVINNHSYDSIKNILIHFGGTEQDDLIKSAILGILKSRIASPLLSITILGVIKNTTQEFISKQLNKKNIKYLITSQNITSHYLNSDIAIGSAGVSALERCSLGLPSILIQIADNQNSNINALTSHGAALSIKSNNTTNEIMEIMETLSCNPDSLLHMHKKALSLIDGKGALRVARSIVTSKTAIKIRIATSKDSRIVLKWRNNLITRKNSINTSAIKSSRHKSWYRKSMRDNDTVIYIAEINLTPVGVLKIETTGNAKWHISWNISPKQRGKGIGKLMLSYFINNTNKEIIAAIRNENISSIRIAEHAGLIKINSDDEYLYYSNIQTIPGAILR